MNRIPGRLFLRNLVERRALLAQLVRRDFQQRYVGSAAGWLWGVVHPLVLLASYIFVFQVCLKVKLPPGAATQNYTMYLFCGVLPWLLFSETVTRSAGSMVENSNLITKTVFPAEVVPVSIFLSSLMQHLIALVLTDWRDGIHAEDDQSDDPPAAAVYVVHRTVGGVGVGWIAASLHVYIRDTAQVLAVAMTLWFWLTPIMINEQQIPPRFRAVILWNPMSWIVRAYRERLFLATWPTWHELGVLTAYSVTVFVVGGLFFRHLKRGFADVL